MAADLAREPVSLDEAKKHLGVRTAFRDDEIARLVVAAREKVEEYTGRALTRRTVVDQLGGFGSTREPACLTFGPVHSVTAVRYLAAAGDLVALAAVARVIRFVNSFRLYPTPGQSWPSLGEPALVEVEYEAGFGPREDGSAGDPVPELLRQAMLLLVGTWFENHEGAVVGTVTAELPFGVRELCRGFRPSGLA